MVEFHDFAVGLHREIPKIAEDRLVTTIRAMMIHKSLFHTRLLSKIRSRKRQIDILVNIRELRYGIQL